MKKILILGSTGMVGSALVKHAEKSSEYTILQPRRSELDLCIQSRCEDYFHEHKPDQVVVSAAKVGGIHANDTFPAEFIYENLTIATNSIHSAYLSGVKRLLFLGSSCIYPKLAPQPMKEDYLLTGELEPTNEAYAIAKIAGLKLCQYYRKQYGVLYHSLMPTNLYGYGDNYHPENSHVIPGLIRRFHEAKLAQTESVTIWGTGQPKREFLHVDDLASACFHSLKLNSPEDILNVGCGEDITIIDLAYQIAEVIGYDGDILTDPSKPDGTPRKLMDNSLLETHGWTSSISLRDGLKSTYSDFKTRYSSNDYRHA